MDATQTATQLAGARDGRLLPWQQMLPADTAAAYAVQDATLALLGPHNAWKVGSPGPAGAIHCAPLPARGVLASGATLSGPQWQWRCIEVEAALRLGRDLHPQGRLLTREELLPAFDAVLPAIEVVETRYVDGRSSDPLAKLADLQCHGALLLGEPSRLAPADLDLRQLHATLAFNGEPVADTVGGNPAQDVWRMLAWLALHCEQRGLPLRQGQVVTTGSCTGLLAAPAGAQVRGEVAGLGVVELRFA